MQILIRVQLTQNTVDRFLSSVEGLLELFCNFPAGMREVLVGWWREHSVAGPPGDHRYWISFLAMELQLGPHFHVIAAHQ